jgi:hypothetical protein
MTTAQGSTNGHRVFPPPCSLPHSQEENQSKDSSNNNESPTPATEAFPANAYHVPPTRYAPKAGSYRYDDTLDLPPDTTPLPERCQFMFSDGRQCTMGRSEIHPSLCPYHSEREDQLFGTPSAGGSVVGAGFDLPELYSACRDLTTAAGVNRALGQVFRLLAQRRISRQEAATFAKLGQLLLQSISAARSESVASGEDEQPMAPVVERQKGVPITPLLPHEKVVPSSDAHPNTKPPAKPGPSFRATIGSEESLSAPPTREESLPQITRPSLDAPPAVSHALSEPAAVKNPSGIDTSATATCNSLEINTYENTEVKTVHNEHLRKKRRAV